MQIEIVAAGGRFKMPPPPRQTPAKRLPQAIPGPRPKPKPADDSKPAPAEPSKKA